MPNDNTSLNVGNMSQNGQVNKQETAPPGDAEASRYERLFADGEATV